MKDKPPQDKLQAFILSRFIELRSRKVEEKEALRQVAFEGEKQVVDYLTKEGFSFDEATARAKASVDRFMKNWLQDEYKKYLENPYHHIDPGSFADNLHARGTYLKRFRHWRKQGYPPRMASLYAWQDVASGYSTQLSSEGYEKGAIDKGKSLATKARVEAGLPRHPYMKNPGSYTVIDSETNRIVCAVKGTPKDSFKYRGRTWKVVDQDGDILYATSSYKDNRGKKAKKNPEFSGQPLWEEEERGMIRKPPAPHQSQEITPEELAEAIRLIKAMKRIGLGPGPGYQQAEKIWPLYHVETKTPLGFAKLYEQPRERAYVSNGVETFTIIRVDQERLLVSPLSPYRYAVIAYHRDKKDPQGDPTPKVLFHIQPARTKENAASYRTQLKHALMRKGYSWRRDSQGLVIRVFIVPWSKVTKYQSRALPRSPSTPSEFPPPGGEEEELGPT